MGRRGLLLLVSLVVAACSRSPSSPSLPVPSPSAPSTLAPACDTAVRINRAWVLRGGGIVLPAAGALQVAIDISIDGIGRIHATLHAPSGTELHTPLEWVLLSSAGEPLQRSYQRWGDGVLRERVALVTAMPADMPAGILDINGCRYPFDVQKTGPAWPAAAHREVLRIMHAPTGNLVALIRTTGVLPNEDQPPTLQRKGTEPGTATQMNSATLVETDARGRPVSTPGDAWRPRHFVVEYDLRSWKTDPPNEHACHDRWCALPPEQPWRLDPAARSALDEQDLPPPSSGKEKRAAPISGSGPVVTSVKR